MNYIPRQNRVAEIEQHQCYCLHVFLIENSSQKDEAVVKINSRTVIPDQSELDQVDENALKRGHEAIVVDRDGETLTEIIEGVYT